MRSGAAGAAFLRLARGVGGAGWPTMVILVGANPALSSAERMRAARTAFISPALWKRAFSSLGGGAADDRAWIRTEAPSFLAVPARIFTAAIPSSETSIPFLSISLPAAKLIETAPALLVMLAPNC